VFTLPRGDNMTAVIESARIPLDVHHLWEELGHFGDVVWIPLIVSGV
jgi:hypothetical protein